MGKGLMGWLVFIVIIIAIIWIVFKTPVGSWIGLTAK